MDKSVINKPLTEQFYLQFFIGIFAIFLAIVILSVLLKFLLSELDKIRLSLNEIANGHGDLTKRLPVNSDDEVGQLAASFNQFIEQMHGIISRLKNTSKSLLKEAKDAADSADIQYSQLQLHQSELHMVATAVTEMASATQEISNNAESTSFAAQETVSLSKQGRTQVEQSQHSIANLASEVSSASKIIDELNEHAQNITSILATISSIADQTNLLALNAAIEAARAGENGRGFAVVADEVRVLSMRTHDSTKEIDSMIIQLQNATSRAVATMHKGGEIANQSVNDAQAASVILAKIASSIDEINDMSAQIATAAEEQASVTLEINNNTETIKEVGDTMSRSSELARNSALVLKKLGEDINAEVSQFTL